MDINLEDRLKYDWLFGLLFYGEKVSRNQLNRVPTQHSSVTQIIKYANGIESLLDEMTEDEWDNLGSERIRIILLAMGYMRNSIRMNAKMYYSIMEQQGLKKELAEHIGEFNEWLKVGNEGIGLNKYNDIEFIMPEMM